MNGSDEIGITDEDKVEKLKKGLEENNLQDYVEDNNGNVVWLTDLMGYLRLKMQFDKLNLRYIGEIVCFIMLVVFTVIFSFTYIKRVLYMAFLTLISPFVALTYSIDKVNDGQAQGFNKWIKEYIFNLLIQPMHLLLYYILVTSAFDLAGANMVYSVAAIGFMIPAEKMLRSLFGFEKAHTPPSLVGALAGASIASSAFNRLRGGVQKNLQSARKNEKENDETDNNIRNDRNLIDNEFDPIANLAEGNDNEDSTLTQDSDRELNEGQTQRRITAPIGAQNQVQSANQQQPSSINSAQSPIRIAPNIPDENLANTRQLRTNTGSRYTSRQRLPRRQESKLTKAGRVARVLAPKAGKLVIKGAKTLGKAYVGAQIAAGTAIAGGAYSLATSGDFGKTVQGAFAGGAAGLAGMNMASNLALSGIDAVERNAREIRDAWHGDDPEYEQRQRNKEIEKLIKNAQFRNQIENKIGQEQFKRMEEQGDLKKYVEQGVQNPEEIVALQQFQEEAGIDSNKALATWKIHKSMAGGKNTRNMTDRAKIEKALEDKFAREYTRETGENRTQAKALKDKTMGYMDILSKHLHGY